MKSAPAQDPVAQNPLKVRTCIHVHRDGRQCGSPAMRRSPRCHYHHPHRRQLKRRIIRETLRTPEGRVQAVELLFQSVLNDRVNPQTARYAPRHHGRNPYRFLNRQDKRIAFVA